MDYFDCDYFDPTYFDTPDCGPVVSATGGRSGRWYPIPALEPIPELVPVDDDEDALIASGTI